MTKKVMKLLNPSTGLMQCRVCKARLVGQHQARRQALLQRRLAVREPL
jgi:hypothetical protein